jgi:hypothetical protein
MVVLETCYFDPADFLVLFRAVFAGKCLMKKTAMKTILALTGLVIFTYSISIYAQPRTIRGQVTDTDNILLPGVSIVIKNTIIGACSDMDGCFVIETDSPDSCIKKAHQNVDRILTVQLPGLSHALTVILSPFAEEYTPWTTYNHLPSLICIAWPISF